MDFDLVLRTSAILIAAAGIARLLRSGAPATRHLVWHTSIVLVLLAPVLAPLAPEIGVKVPLAYPVVSTNPNRLRSL